MFASASLLGLCLATLGLPVLFVALQRLDVGPPTFTGARLRLGVGLQWGIALLVAVFVLVVEGRPLASVGVTFDPLTFLGGAVLGWVLAGGSTRRRSSSRSTAARRWSTARRCCCTLSRPAGRS